MQSRAGKGLINYHTETYGKVAMIAPVREDQDIIMISQEGIVIRTPVDQISAFKRPAKGVRVMRTTDEDKVITLSVVEHMEPEKTDDTPEGDGTRKPQNNRHLTVCVFTKHKILQIFYCNDIKNEV